MSYSLLSTGSTRWSVKRRDVAEKNVESDVKYQYKRKVSTQNNKRDPCLETLLQLCAPSGPQVYL